MMASRYRLRLKRHRRRERARARAAQATEAQPRSNGAEIFKSLEKRFNELLAPKTPDEILANALASKN